ncbi:hypothetical protein E6H24_04230 [Candidatus Bathyarchaeota archaeon]|nr:MAG: hypothetical protein E6H24_04230 [Candidatus Bathyarchaeota archaeon]
MTQRTRKPSASGFSEKELRYLMERSLGRLAFVCSDMQAHIMPVLFEFDGSYFYLSRKDELGALDNVYTNIT